MFQKSVSWAWYCVQWSGFLVRAQDLELAGASPKYSAIWAFTSGETMWFSHRYEQLMFGVSFLIIQVSDQPVAPSVGLVVPTVSWSALARFAVSCQPWDSVTAPEASPWPCLTTSAQYSATSGFCCCTSLTAASNWAWSSAYGFLMPSCGWVDIRYTAASAM